MEEGAQDTLSMLGFDPWNGGIGAGIEWLRGDQRDDGLWYSRNAGPRQGERHLLL